MVLIAIIIVFHISIESPEIVFCNFPILDESQTRNLPKNGDRAQLKRKSGSRQKLRLYLPTAGSTELDGPPASSH